MVIHNVSSAQQAPYAGLTNRVRRMPVRYRRTALAALAALAAGTALALAGPSVTTGSMWVQGSGYGTVSVHGDVVVLGATTGPGQLEVRTGRSGASIGMNGHQRRIAPNRDVDLDLAVVARRVIERQRLMADRPFADGEIADRGQIVQVEIPRPRGFEFRLCPAEFLFCISSSI